jgi:hypothetical protein
MKNKLIIATIIAGFALPFFAAQASVTLGISASASTTVATGGVKVGLSAAANAKLTALVQKGQQRADQEITRRIKALNALSIRVNGMTRLSTDEKSSMSTTIQTQITAMNTLQAQIATDAAANSTTSLKTDIQSITKSYRIFALVIPQGAIEAASDRVLTVASDLQTISGKLQTRITAAQAAGVNMNTSVTALADMNAKITDANTQVNAAVSETASLQPDNGDATIQASNTAALKDAHAKIQAAQKDLVAARADAGTIVKALLAVKVSVTASSTVSASTTTP